MKYPNLKALLRKRFSVPKERALKRTMRSFTAAERAVFFAFVAIFLTSGLALLWRVNSAFLTEVPIRGGKIVEGIIGNPRFINPVLALSEADKSLSALVYSGLVRISPERKVVNDLAESVEVSDDGLTYTARIREDASFHDGEPVTADDIIFTIQKITDPVIKSPRRGNWDGVVIEKLDDLTVSFRLRRPYAPFMENLTVGILPHHIWKNVTGDEFTFSQFNTLPIGSGPYLVSKVERNSGGIPDYYELRPFDSESEEEPYIEKLVFRFFPSEESLAAAYSSGDIESVGGISADRAAELEDDGAHVVSSPLPRVFGVFFNQNQAKIFIHREVRRALDLASPKEQIVEEIFNGYATPIDGPLPPELFDWTSEPEKDSDSERFARAQELLADNGWKMNEETGVLEKKSGNDNIQLSFSISTGDVPELKAVAEKLAGAWRNLGASVEITVFETGELNQNVIRPRKFDSLLFGEVVGRDADVYPFWHSSQRNDPGLNIALYANPRVDRLLETARTTSDPKKREESYKAFHEEIQSDMPAVFLYSPSYLYVLPEKVRSASLGGLTASQDKFLGIRDWYIETDKVWKIFAD